MADKLKVDLIEDYLVQRPALKRFLVARLRDEHTAEDILQEIYLKLDRMSEDTLVENRSAFFYRVANNLVLDYRKAMSRRRIRDHDWSGSRLTMAGAEPVHDVPDADVVLDARRRLARLREGLEQLPPKCQLIFRACKLQGMTYREAAAYYEISVGTVEKHISKALKYLLKYLGSDNNDS